MTPDKELATILEGINKSGKLYLYWIDKLNQYFQYQDQQLRSCHEVKVKKLPHQ